MTRSRTRAPAQDVDPRDLPDVRTTLPMAPPDTVWPEMIIGASSSAAPAPAPVARADARFMLSHPAHLIALGFGSGLSPLAPGTVGTLWAWLSFIVLNLWLTPAAWAVLIAAALAVGWWATTLTARRLLRPDPACIVCDEIVAFWLVLWIIMPADQAQASLWLQAGAFVLFRWFDTVKPGPVRWADMLFKAQRWRARDGSVGWWQGLGVVLDDLVAALLTLLVLAAAVHLGAGP